MVRRGWGSRGLDFKKKLAATLVSLLVAPFLVGVAVVVVERAMAPSERPPAAKLEVIDLKVSGGSRTSPVVDVTLRNVGELVSVVRRASLTVRDFARLEVCFGTGEYLPSSHRYDVALPDEPARGETSSVNLTQEIRPNEADRFALRLGVPETPISGEARTDPLLLYQLDLQLYLDKARDPLNVGTVVVGVTARPHDPVSYIFTGDLEVHADFLKSCWRRNGVTYRHFQGLEGVKDEELIGTRWSSPSSPTSSPGGAVSRPAKIAFASNRDGDFEVYSMNADGSAQRRLSANPAGDGTPAFSADGTKIAFTSNRDGDFEVYSMNADGSAQRRLTANPSLDGTPAFSPDGRKIAFASNRSGYGDVYVMNADGSGQIWLTASNAVDAQPTWSPDGTKIAFTSARSRNSDVYVMNADGSGQIRLTTSTAVDSSPDWSSDGTKISFTSNRDGNFEIYSMNADGSGQVRLTTNPADDREPAFVATGKIAFTSSRDGNFEIYSMNADGSGQGRLVINPALDDSPDAP